MKESSGELNITLITILAIAAIASLFLLVIKPRLQTAVENGIDQTVTEANQNH